MGRDLQAVRLQDPVDPLRFLRPFSSLCAHNYAWHCYGPHDLFLICRACLYSGADTPMKKQGGVILGAGGDNSHRSIGTWMEGAIAAGYSTDATDDAVHANVVAAYAGATLIM
eukprot:SAG22_NODE_1918_length_3313_cov_4.560361_4_plen_113_part_00